MTETPDSAPIGEVERPTRAGAHPNYRPLSTLPVELRRTGVPEPVRDWILRELGVRVAATRRLPGASSTAVHLVTLVDGQTLVLRRYAWSGFLEDEPIAVKREVDALEFAMERQLPAPRLIAADIDGREVGDGVPALLMERIHGRAVSTPDVVRLAEAAAALHDVRGGFDHDYFRWFGDDEYHPPRNARQLSLWEWALEVWSQPPPTFQPVFIHRDYHPGNVLWRSGIVSGIVDWANACIGPADCDVATCRGDLLRIAGPVIADAWVDAYVATSGRDFDPYWEVVGVLEHGPSPWTGEQISQSEHRLRLARAAFGGSPGTERLPSRRAARHGPV